MASYLERLEARRQTSLKRKVVASYFGGGWSAVMALAFVPLYVRYLGIESYGLIGFFATLQVWLSVLDMGLSATLTREMALFSAGSRGIQDVRNLLRSTEVIFAGVALLLAALVVLLSPFIATYWLKASALGPRTIADAISLMGIVVAFQWIGTLYRNCLVGLQHQVWLGYATAGIATVRALGSVLVLSWSPTITAFFMFQAAVSAVEALVLGRHLHRSLPQPAETSRFSGSALRRVWRFAGGLTTISLLATLLTQLDKVLLSKLLPLDQFGYFMLTATIASVISVFVVPIHNVAYPRIAEVMSIGSEDSLADEYHKFAQLLSIGMWPVAIMLVLFPTELLLLWTGDPVLTRAVAPLLSVWVMGTALNSLTHVPHMAQLAHGWTKLGIISGALMVSVTIPLIFFLVPRYGAMAAAWSWVAVNVGYLVFAIPAMHSQILRGEKWKWYVGDVLAPLVAGVVVALALKPFVADSLGSTVIGGLLGSGLLIFLAVGMTTKLGRQAAASLVSHLRRR